MSSNKGLTYKMISGFVGDEPVTAFVYPGADSGLSSYTYKGNMYIGTVKFTVIVDTVELPYSS